LPFFDLPTFVDAPRDGPIGRLLLALDRADEQLGRQPLALAERLAQVFAQAAGIEPFFLVVRAVHLERDTQAGTEHRLRAQHVLQLRHRERRRFEELRIGPEADLRARVVLADLVDDLELRADFAVLEADVVFLAAALDPALEVLRQRVHDGDADAVEAAGELVVLIREFAARMQAREDELDAAHLLFRMDVDRHAAAIVGDFERAVLVEHDVDALCVPGHRLVDRVVDDFVREMIRAARVGVHARPATYRFEPTQNFDVGSGVGLSHSCRRFRGANVVGIRAARILYQ